jgi:hypothetical protein
MIGSAKIPLCGSNFVEESNARYDLKAVAYARKVTKQDHIPIDVARQLYAKRLLDLTNKTAEEIRHIGLNADVET